MSTPGETDELKAKIKDLESKIANMLSTKNT